MYYCKPILKLLQKHPFMALAQYPPEIPDIVPGLGLDCMEMTFTGLPIEEDLTIVLGGYWYIEDCPNDVACGGNYSVTLEFTADEVQGGTWTVDIGCEEMEFCNTCDQTEVDNAWAAHGGSFAGLANYCMDEYTVNGVDILQGVPDHEICYGIDSVIKSGLDQINDNYGAPDVSCEGEPSC